MIICYFCKKDLSVEGRITRKDLCPYCSSPLHVCVNCRFYDRSAHNSCREPVAEWVRDKEKENFCDYFGLADNPASGQGEAELAREQLKRLFG